MKPLEGFLVVEVGRETAGRYATRLLGEFGARVIRIVPPGVEALSGDDPSIEANDLWLDLGKEVLAPASAEQTTDVTKRLLGDADILVETLPDESLVEFALEQEALEAAATGLVVVSLTPFGRRSARSGWRAGELGLQGFGGFLALSGAPDREPVRAALEQVHLTAGRVGAVAALAGWFGGERPTGRRYDISLAEVAMTLPPFHIQQYTHTGAIAGRGPALEPPLDGEHVPTRDGAISFATGNTPPEMFAALLEAEELVDERFQTPQGRATGREDLARIVHAATAGRTSRDLFERALELNIVAGLVQDPETILRCSHLEARGEWSTVTLADGRAVRLPSGGVAAPGLDRATPIPPRSIEDETQLGPLPASEQPARPPASEGGHPLEGVTVVSFEDVIALPWATVQLAHLGARVIRVESLTRLQARHWGVFPDNYPGPEFWNEGGNLCSLYREKESVALDLQEPLGHEAALRLVRHADVLLANYRPGVLERLGLGDDVLRSVNPQAVILHASGYGETGPYARMGAFARTIDAMSGLTDLTGYAGGPALRANPSYMDAVSAWSIAFATLLGLIALHRSGDALTIDHSMYGAGVSTIGAELVQRQLGGKPRTRRGNMHPQRTLDDVYATADGRWIAIEIPNRQAEAALESLIGRGAVEDGDLATTLASWCAERDGAAAERLLQSHAIAGVLVRDARALVCDDDLHMRGAFEWVRTPTGRLDYVRPYAAPPLREAPATVRSRVLDAPALGEHSEGILVELAGLTRAEIEKLRETGATGTEPRPGVVSRPAPLDIERGLARGALLGHDPAYEERVARVRRSLAERAK